MENELFTQKQLSEMLVSVAWAATQDLDLDVVMNNVVQTAVNLTKAETGGLILLDTRQQIVGSILASNNNEPIVQKVSDLQHIMDEGLAGWVVRQGEAALISDATHDDRWIQLPNQPIRIRSALAVPMTERSDVMGVLTMTHASPYHFTEQDKLFLRAAANQMALA
jgi:GAF domain-containing protein